LTDIANLEEKTMFCCVRYTANGQEYWDNNNSTNFQVDFQLEKKPQNGAASKHDSNGLSRSNARSPTTTVDPSEKLTAANPDNFDDFLDEKYKLLDFQTPLHTYIEESATPPWQKDVDTAVDCSEWSSSVSGKAFSNRYDFAASLSAAINTSYYFPAMSPRQRRLDEPEA
jgi:hypothetical protein